MKCVGKQLFESFAAAMLVIRRRKRTHKRDGMVAYRCESCRGYHLGHNK